MKSKPKLKRSISALLTAALIFGLAAAMPPNLTPFAPATASAAPGDPTTLVFTIDNTSYQLNGAASSMDVTPAIIEGRTLLPIRFVAEPLGAAIGWDEGTSKVTIQLMDTLLELWIGQSNARVSGTTVAIDSANPNVKPLIINGRTMLPVRFVTENLGCNVKWEEATQQVIITKNADGGAVITTAAQPPTSAPAATQPSTSAPTTTEAIEIEKEGMISLEDIFSAVQIEEMAQKSAANLVKSGYTVAASGLLVSPNAFSEVSGATLSDQLTAQAQLDPDKLKALSDALNKNTLPTTEPQPTWTQHYIKDIAFSFSSESADKAKFELEKGGYTLMSNTNFDEGIRKNGVNYNWYTYIGYKTTTDPRYAIKDMFVGYDSQLGTGPTRVFDHMGAPATYGRIGLFLSDHLHLWFSIDADMPPITLLGVLKDGVPLDNPTWTYVRYYNSNDLKNLNIYGSTALYLRFSKIIDQYLQP